MGWFKSLASKITKPFAKAIDPLLPEKAKDVLNKVAIGGLAFGGAFEKPEQATTAATPAAALDASSLTDDEMTAEAQKRLAKLGKYFTSPLGVLQNASSGSQRVFS